MSGRSKFYRSDDWEVFVKCLREKRTNNEGFVICECCGKPIVKAYDCIGHHVIPLTEENVNDVNISLNPNNVQLVHHKCHNVIHDRFGIHYERKVYIVYGAPLSGKTTWVNENKSEGDLIIDIDNIWQCVSGCDRYIKPNRLKSNVFGVRDLLLDMVKYRRGKWLNAYIVGGYPLISERERLCNELDAELIYIEATKEECLQRLMRAEDERNKEEWQKYIEDWFAYTPPPKM